MPNQAPEQPRRTGPVTLWLYGRIEDDPAQSLAAAVARGVQHHVGARSPEEVQTVRDAGLDPWLFLGAFSVSEDERHLQCRSLDGKPRVWFSSGCPSHPAVRQRLLDRIRDMAGWGASGIMLDGIRFASPYEGPETFFTCTCRWCVAAAADQGLSMPRIREGLRRLWDQLASVTPETLRRALPAWQAPADLLARVNGGSEVWQWLQYRTAVITDTVAEVRAVLRAAAPEMQLGAYVFTPSLAPLVGQDYAALEAHLDLVAPMIYRLGDGPACLAPEVAGLADLLSGVPPQEQEMAALQFLGLAPAYRAGSPLRGGLAVDAVAIESQRARGRLSGRAKLVPILWLDDPEVVPATAAALAAALDGISYFPTGDARALRLGQVHAFLSGLPAAP
jgi:hypothetical protein